MEDEGVDDHQTVELQNNPNVDSGRTGLVLVESRHEGTVTLTLRFRSSHPSGGFS